MATTTERRRNQYADTCRVCSANVAAGQGWLYSDTRSDRSRSRRRVGRSWLKFVKCDRCHQRNLSHRFQVENLEHPKPPVQKVGVNDVRRGQFRMATYDGPTWKNQTAVELVLADGTAEIVAQLSPIKCDPIGVGQYLEDGLCFGGRTLTTAAVAEVTRLGYVAAEMFEVYLLCGGRNYDE